MVGDRESKRLKVAVLILFHPTASPLFQKAVFSYYDTIYRGGGRTGGGTPSSGGRLASREYQGVLKQW